MGQLPRLDDGNWPDIPFARAVPGDMALDLDITAGLLDLGAGQTARNAKLQLVLLGDSISIDGLRADWAGGMLQGDMTIGASGHGLEMSLRAAAENVALEEIIWRKDGRSIARGTFGGSVSVAGSGRSLAGLVSTLNGSGSLLRHGRRLNSGPHPLPMTRCTSSHWSAWQSCRNVGHCTCARVSGVLSRRR